MKQIRSIEGPGLMHLPWNKPLVCIKSIAKGIFCEGQVNKVDDENDQMYCIEITNKMSSNNKVGQILKPHFSSTLFVLISETKTDDLKEKQFFFQENNLFLVMKATEGETPGTKKRVSNGPSEELELLLGETVKLIDAEGLLVTYA